MSCHDLRSTKFQSRKEPHSLEIKIPLILYLLFHSFNNHIPNTYSTAGTAQGAKDKKIHGTRPHSPGLLPGEERQTGKQIITATCSVWDVLCENEETEYLYSNWRYQEMWVPVEMTFELKIKYWESNENCYHANNQTHTEKICMYFNLLVLNIHNRPTVSGLIKNCNYFVKRKIIIIKQTWNPDSGSVILRERIVLLIWKNRTAYKIFKNKYRRMA